MEQALYGRFKNGKCMNSEAHYCSRNVLQWMDDKCSGRNKCEIKITDLYSELYELTNCSEMPYFKSSYICKRGNVIFIYLEAFQYLFYF